MTTTMVTKTRRLWRSGTWPLLRLLLLPGLGRVVLVMMAETVTLLVRKWETKVVVTVAGAVPRLYRRMGSCFKKGGDGDDD